MSHFTKLDKADITDPKAFVAAAQELGFDGKVEEDTQLRGFDGNTLKADVAIRCKKYDLGIVKNERGRYDMIADFWGLRMQGLPEKLQNMGVSTDEGIQHALLRTTTKHSLMSTYKRKGFMARVQEDEKHNITVTLTR